MREMEEGRRDGVGDTGHKSKANEARIELDRTNIDYSVVCPRTVATNTCAAVMSSNACAGLDSDVAVDVMEGVFECEQAHKLL